MVTLVPQLADHAAQRREVRHRLGFGQLDDEPFRWNGAFPPLGFQQAENLRHHQHVQRDIHPDTQAKPGQLVGAGIAHSLRDHDLG